MAKKDFKFAIFCGHGKSQNGSWDPGCTYKGYTEAALMLPITQSTVLALRRCGATVITDAFDSNNINMIEQVKLANKNNVQLFLSFHCDWYKAPAGVMPLYLSAKGRELGVAINKEVMATLGMKTRQVVKRTNLHELNKTDMVACVLETGSIKGDLAILRDKPKLYGEAVARAICSYSGLKYVPEDDTEEIKQVVTGTVSKPKSNKISVDGLWGQGTTKATCKALGIAQVVKVTGQLTSCRKYLPNAQTSSWTFAKVSTKGSPVIKAIQKLVKVKQDGKAGKQTVTAMQKFLKSKGFYAGKIDGIMGKATVMGWQKYVNSKL